LPPTLLQLPNNFAHAESTATPEDITLPQNPPSPLAKENCCLDSEEVDSEKRCLDVKGIPFSAEEDAMLQKAKERNPDAPWSIIAAMMNRTENSVADRWYQHLLTKSNHQHKRSAPQEGPRLHQDPPKRATAATQKPKGWTGYTLVEEGEHKPSLLTGGLFEPQSLTTERVSIFSPCHHYFSHARYRKILSAVLFLLLLQGAEANSKFCTR
jgi:hypothetical protein